MVFHFTIPVTVLNILFTRLHYIDLWSVCQCTEKENEFHHILWQFLKLWVTGYVLHRWERHRSRSL